MTLTEALDALDGKVELTAEDALALRRIIYAGDATISRPEADALFKLNAASERLSPEWCDLFIEAMTDFVVVQEQPAGYVDQAKADWLVAAVRQAGRIREDEIEMLVHVLERADQTPAALTGFVLETLKALVLHKLQQRGTLEARDIERIRRTLYAAGGEGNIAVTRREAELLFDINDALNGAETDPAWTELFKRAVANAVLFASPWKPDRDAELHRQAFLADRHWRLASHFSGIFTRAGRGEMGDELHDLARLDLRDHGLDRAYAALDAEEADAERLTAEEAHWLADRIGQSGRCDANEQALVAFIKANARPVDSELDTLIARLETATG
jgi:hypothetical protein